MSKPKSAAETVAGARGRVEEPIVRYKRVVISRSVGLIYCCPTAAKAPGDQTGGFPFF